MAGVPGELGFQLVLTGRDLADRGPEPDDDPVLVRSLGPGVGLVVTALAGTAGAAWSVRASHARCWGLTPATVVHHALAASARLPADRLVWRLGGSRWLTLLRGGPLTTGLVTDLARRVPGGGGHGLVAAPDPGTLAVVAGARALRRAETERAAELLYGLVEQGTGTIRSLIRFHPAGEFAIFGRDRNRPDPFVP